MTLKDFRIGNYYMNDKGAAVLDYWHFDCYKHEEIEPIPLTEEWLLKFGFTKSNGVGWECMRFCFNSNSQSIDVFISEGYCTVTGMDENAVEWKLKYVHQLQNLYFALTGEELV